MKAMKGLHLFMVLTVLVNSTVILVPAVNAQTPNDPAANTQTIHYLQVIVDTHSRSAARHQNDRKKMAGLMEDVETMIENKRPSAKYEKSELLSSDKQVTRDNILGWIENLQPSSDDIVFVYFSGHGGADVETKDMYITLQGKVELARKDIAKAMEGLDCRLKILITDACSTGPRVIPTVITTANPIDLNTALYNLFFEHEGFLNISSASEGEKAVGDNTNGSYFTESLASTIWDGVEHQFIDFAPKDGFVSWAEVFELTKEATMEMFERNKVTFPSKILEAMSKSGQTTQTPKYFGELPKRFER